MSRPIDARVAAAVVGASGYSGAETVGLLLGHPRFRLTGLFGSGRGENEVPFDRLHPRFRTRCDLPVKAAEPKAIAACGAKVAFLATPHEASLELVPELLEAGLRVVDLSGAFRLKDPAQYPRHYGFEHPRPDLLEEAVYGLPELDRGSIEEARLVANPGCYPTSVALPLAPILRSRLADAEAGIVADCISGVSGAGRRPSPATHFCEVSAKAYGVFSHRHAPEIAQAVGAPVVFVPHLAPFDRGILATIHFRAAAGTAEGDLRSVLAKAYAGRPFVRLLPAGEHPSVAAVEGTNFCDIALAFDAPSRRAVLLSAIDNLGKGAAGQAVQNADRMFGFAETEGIL
ncbi:MAG TPA: N-acetyl-gamma-glutamyl-phosphate reductase [Planctomycetota bacterium]|nr:N-acetyl-gamma-glutamyl-phosphate reductase [Planctomycetota bacterium]